MKARLSAANLSAPQVFDNLGTIVVYDDFDAPILVVEKMVDGLILSYTPEDPQFRVALKTLGIGLNARYRITDNGPGSKKSSTPGA